MSTDKGGLIEEETTRLIIGAFYSVYNELGSGFLEQVYENAMVIALLEAGLDVVQQVPVDVYFRGNVVGSYRADLLVPDKVLIEVKASKMLTPVDEAQLQHYLKATGTPVGMLLNFGPGAEIRRRVRFDRFIGLDPCKSVVKEDV